MFYVELHEVIKIELKKNGLELQRQNLKTKIPLISNRRQKSSAFMMKSCNSQTSPLKFLRSVLITILKYS